MSRHQRWAEGQDTTVEGQVGQDRLAVPKGPTERACMSWGLSPRLSARRLVQHISWGKASDCNCHPTISRHKQPTFS